MFEKAINLGNWLSLATAAAAIAYCVCVANDFGRTAWHAVRSGMRNSQDWLICGVFISFASKVLDGGFWELAWTVHYLEPGIAKTMLAFGPIVNLVFRNSLWLLAGYCHTRGLAEAAGGGEISGQVLRRLNACCLFGVTYGLVVELFKLAGGVR